MAKNGYLEIEDGLLPSCTDLEASRVIKECAATLAIVSHKQGIKWLQFMMGIASADGPDIGDWRMTIERMDTKYMVQ